MDKKSFHWFFFASTCLRVQATKKLVRAHSRHTRLGKLIFVYSIGIFIKAKEFTREYLADIRPLIDRIYFAFQKGYLLVRGLSIKDLVPKTQFRVCINDGPPLENYN